MNDLADLAQRIKNWAAELGFAQCGIADLDVSQDHDRFMEWLAKQFHGDMRYLENNQAIRRHPEKLTPNTQRVICVRMDYLPPEHNSLDVLKNKALAYVARYTLGKDYHKLIRKRLTQLAKRIETETGARTYRAFADSAPILERPLAAKAGIGWQGKNTLILNRHAGSWFFLGELLIDLPLPIDSPTSSHCGSCTACIDICPTKAIVAPYQLDARKCISYLTIEYKGRIDPELRPLMGNRIFGCDDCQLVCPWNKFAKTTKESAFYPRHQLDQASLLTLFNWSEATFLKNTQGSAIRRATYNGWLRNIAIALGNAPYSTTIINDLEKKKPQCNTLVQEHIQWAIAAHVAKKP